MIGVKIVHETYGAGYIIKENLFSFAVLFRSGLKEISYLDFFEGETEPPLAVIPDKDAFKVFDRHQGSSIRIMRYFFCTDDVEGLGEFFKDSL